MSDVLRKICADKAQHVAQQKGKTPLAELRKRIGDATPPRGFHRALQSAVAAGRYGLIAEIKKASPSKGVIRADFDPPSLARAYADGGATCLSVLTDVPYFQGDDSFLIAARAACSLPVLRKDFMIDPYQVYEARALGADCILIIIAALSLAQAQELETLAFELGMDVLIEVHNREELQTALQLKSRLLGVNNRDLKTLKVDIGTTASLAPDVPQGYTLVSESGLETPENLAEISKIGAKCFLIGESLMRQADVTTATKKLLAV